MGIVVDCTDDIAVDIVAEDDSWVVVVVAVDDIETLVDCCSHTEVQALDDIHNHLVFGVYSILNVTRGQVLCKSTGQMWQLHQCILSFLGDHFENTSNMVSCHTLTSQCSHGT